MKKVVLILAVMLLNISALPSITKEEPTYETVYNQIVECGIEFPDIVFAQSVLESGHYKSEVFRANNNMFGMKMPSIRETVALGKNLGYALYNNWQSSVTDYMLWQKNVMKTKTFSRAQYYAYLDKRYAHKGYSAKVKQLVKRFNNEVPNELNDGVCGI